MCLVFSLFIPFASSDAEETETEEAMLRNAVRIRSIHTKRVSPTETLTITGHGTAFGIDLSEFGLRGPRYLLTAAHTVWDQENRSANSLWIEIRTAKSTYWARCRIRAFHKSLDICLLESERDLPFRSELAKVDSTPGSAVVMAGSPRGIPPKLFRGVLAADRRMPRTRTLAHIAFDHGDSGGPLYDARSGKVVGMAVAGVPKGDDMDHGVGLFVPLAEIKGFITNVARAESARKTVASVVASPVRPPGPIIRARRTSTPKAEVAPQPVPFTNP